MIDENDVYIITGNIDCAKKDDRVRFTNQPPYQNKLCDECKCCKCGASLAYTHPYGKDGKTYCAFCMSNLETDKKQTDKEILTEALDKIGIKYYLFNPEPISEKLDLKQQVVRILSGFCKNDLMLDIYFDKNGKYIP